MAKKVSAAQAKAQLSALVAQVAYGGVHIIIERRGKPLVALVTVGELENIEQDRAGSSQPRGALALAGAWKDVSDHDLDTLWQHVSSEREKDSARQVQS